VGHLRKIVMNGIDSAILKYIINDPIELNLSYIPFLNHGGLFIPTEQAYLLWDRVVVDLQLPGKKDNLRIEGKVVWITPKNALHHVLPGIGIEFVGSNAEGVRNQIKSSLDSSYDTGGYTYGISEGVITDRK